MVPFLTAPVFLQSLFGASKILFGDLKQLEKQTPDIIIWAAPFMFFFVLLEWYIARKQNNHHLYERKDSIGSSNHLLI